MAISAKRTLNLSVTDDTLDGKISANKQYTNGVTDGKVDREMSFTLVVANTTLTLDLSAPGYAFVKVREIVIINMNTATGEYIEIGGGTNDLDGLGKRKIHPTGIDAIGAPMDGLSVVATTGDTITFDTSGSGATVTVKGRIVGTSA